MFIRSITICSLLLITLLSGSVSAQTPVFYKDWDYRYGGNADDAISWFEKTYDGGLILGGTSFSGVSGDKSEPNYDPTLSSSDFWTIRTDSMGIKIWDKRYGGFNTDVLYKVIHTTDGGFLFAGQSYSGVGGDKSQPNWDASQQSADYWVIRTDSAGTKLWDKRFGGSTFELFGSVKQTGDGGFIMCGSTFSGISGDITAASYGSWDMWVVRIDATGNLLWENRYGGSDDEFATAIDVFQGGAIIGGYSKSPVSGVKSQPSQGSWDYWAVRINNQGTKVWDKTFGGNYADWLFDLIATSDGGFLFGGQSFSDVSGDKSEPNHDAGPSGSDRWVVKTDGLGNKLWDHCYGGDEIEDLSRLYETSDGGFLISGESYSGANGDKSEQNLGVEQTWVLKTDSIGVYEWDKTIFSYGHDEGGTAIQLNDLCFATVNYTLADTGGYKSQITQGNGDYWIVKICIDDPSSVHDYANSTSAWSLYPNPAQHLIRISNCCDPATDKISFEIMNASGQKLITGNEFTNAIDISELKSGLYFIRITGTKSSEVLRFIKTD